MLKITHLLLASIAILSFATACTSLHGKAEKLMQEKSYEDAENIYQQILRKHPDDVDAIVGLKKAREGVISSELLLVRRERLSGNNYQANEQLKSIIDRLSKWQVYPTGAVAFTQNEETDYAIQNIAQHTGELLSVNHPLKAAFLLDHFKDLFQEKNLTLLDRLHKNAAQIGLTHCRQNFAITPRERGFYLEFLARECRYWGDTREMLKQPIQHGLIGHLDLTGSVTGLPPSLTPVFESAIRSAIEESAWYEAASLKHVKLNYQGQFEFNTDRRSTMFTQSYEEQVPYSSNELVYKTRTEMRPVTRMQPGPDGNLTPQTTVEPQEVNYSEMESVTRMRSETRYFNYPGFNIDQTILLNAGADISLPGTNNSSHLTSSKNDRNITTESMTEIPRIGLYRHVARIYDVNEWSLRMIESWRQQIRLQLGEAWNFTHCGNIQTSTVMSQQADEVFACLRNADQNSPPSLDAWLVKNLGLPSLELQSLLM